MRAGRDHTRTEAPGSADHGPTLGRVGRHVRRLLPGAARRHDRQRGAAEDRLGPGGRRQRASMGRGRIRARARVADARRRNDRGPPWAQAGGIGRADRVRRRIARVRSRSKHGVARGRPCSPGGRRGAAAARNPGDHHPRVPRPRGSGQGDRRLGGNREPRPPRRPAARRPVDRRPRLARDLPAQCADRARRPIRDHGTGGRDHHPARPAG
jgi:hypothetical protein